MKKIISIFLTIIFIISIPISTAHASTEDIEDIVYSKEITPRKQVYQSTIQVNTIFPKTSSWDWIRNLAQKIDLSDLLFNGNYDWNAFFKGELDIAESQELAAILNLFKTIISNINLKEIESDTLQEILENEYAEYFINKILDAIEKLLDGDYKDYINLFKGDYSSLVTIIDKLDLKQIINDLLDSKSEQLNDKLNGNYQLLKELVNGNYTYLRSLLIEDYDYAEQLKEILGLNLNILMSNLKYPELTELVKNSNSKALAFVDKYYEAILAISNNDYTYFSEFQEHGYDGFIEMLNDLYAATGYDYVITLDEIADKILALDDQTIQTLISKLISNIYQDLPQEYKDKIGKLTDIIKNVEQFVQIIIKHLGDLNQDDEVSITDVVIVQKYIADINALSESQKDLADVNRDNNINLLDAVMMQKAIANLIIIPSYN